MIELPIIYEHPDFIIVDKPAGMPCQDDKSGHQSAIAALGAGYYLVHRLDRGVSGLMVAAKNREAAGMFAGMLHDRRLHKVYLAVVTGQPPETAELTNYLAKNQRINISRVVNKNAPGAKEAKLHFVRLACTESDYGHMAMLKIDLYTGRHHQIRTQLSHAGYPIWGDRKYNIMRKYWPGNIALRAAWLKFTYASEQFEFAADTIDAHPFDLFRIPGLS